MYRKVILLFPLFIGGFLTAQDAITLQEAGANLNVVYRNEATFGMLAHGHGFGLNYRRARHLTADRKRVLEVEMVSMRHSKEVKVVNPDPGLESAKGFYYGKLNSVLIPRLGVGFQNVLFRKAERKSVEIRYSTFLGVSLAFAKPVYLDVFRDTTVNGERLRTISTERYDPKRHSIYDIYGRGPYFRGFGESRIYPGGYAKLALSFEYADLRHDVKVIETGVTIDAYPRVIPIMANTRNSQLYVNVYVALIYGRKWF